MDTPPFFMRRVGDVVVATTEEAGSEPLPETFMLINLGDIGIQKLIVDATRLEELSPRWMSRLIELATRTRGGGGTMRLCVAQPDNNPAFQRLEKAKILRVFKSLDDALEGF